MAGSLGLTPESLKASGRISEKLSLPILQSQIKREPEGYETEVHLIYKQFRASVDLLQQQAALTFSSVGPGPSVAKELGDRAMFLAHVTPFYPNQLAAFPAQLTDLLRTSCLAMPSGLRYQVAQSLILLMYRKVCFFFLFFYYVIDTNSEMIVIESNVFFNMFALVCVKESCHRGFVSSVSRYSDSW